MPSVHWHIISSLAKGRAFRSYQSHILSVLLYLYKDDAESNIA